MDLGPTNTPEPAAGALAMYLASSPMGIFLLVETPASRVIRCPPSCCPLGRVYGDTDYGTWLTMVWQWLQPVIRAYMGCVGGTSPLDVLLK